MYDLSEKVKPTNGASGEVGEEDEAATRYLYIWGMAAWYWARIAKRRGVGPAGR